MKKKTRPEWIGKRATCKCGEKFIVPEIESTPSVEPTEMYSPGQIFVGSLFGTLVVGGFLVGLNRRRQKTGGMLFPLIFTGLWQAGVGVLFYFYMKEFLPLVFNPFARFLYRPSAIILIAPLANLGGLVGIWLIARRLFCKTLTQPEVKRESWLKTVGIGGLSSVGISVLLAAIIIPVVLVREATRKKIEGPVILNDIEELKTVLDQEPELVHYRHGGDTLLHTAISHADAEMVTLLLDRGLDVNASAEDGDSALLWAVQQLPDLEPGVALRDFQQKSQDRLHGIIKVLLERKADANAVNSIGRPLLFRATKTGDVLVVGLLLENGAEINFQSDVLKQSALSLAVDRNHLEVVRLLLEKGADPTLQDYREDPLNEVAEDEEIKALLEEAIKKKKADTP